MLLFFQIVLSFYVVIPLIFMGISMLMVSSLNMMNQRITASFDAVMMMGAILLSLPIAIITFPYYLVKYMNQGCYSGEFVVDKCLKGASRYVLSVYMYPLMCLNKK